MLQVESYTDTILHNITFKLKADENLIILGSNGAGKSTLAKVLCGLIPSESIKLNQTNSNRLTAKEKTKAINYIPAKLSVFDEYITTREYLELSKLYSPLSIDEVMQKLGIVSLADKPCKQLSSGEQQLTLLASALLHNAKLTLFDEPTANLDPQRTRKVYQLLHANLFQNSVIITHDLTLAFRLGYKVLYLLDGEINFFGESGDFFTEKTLHTIFGDSVKQVDDTYVVNL